MSSHLLTNRLPRLERGFSHLRIISFNISFMMAVGKPLVEVALWLLVLCSGINAAFGSANKETKGVVLCNERERLALLKFKHALNASEYTLTSWVGDNCCSWEGVGCNNETGHVNKLNLRNTINTVSGEIDHSLLELEHLSYLDLSGNDFRHKPIPKFFGSFMKLRYLDLSLASFSGTVPWEIGNITGLSYLNISQNLIHGKIPPVLNFDQAFVDFSSNQFVGPLPQNWSRITSMDLSNNFLSGPIDMSFGSIQFLFLSNNSLHGSIPSLICNSFIVILDLSTNNLTGQVPSCPEDFPYLSILDLSYNNLNGIFPFFRLNFKWLLQLSHNNFSGVLPSSIEAHSILFALDLSGNRFSGSIPRWLGSKTLPLVILNLRSNMFHGNIPPQLSLLSSLQILDLADNRLSGEIPTSFGNFTSMAVTQRPIRHISPPFVFSGGNSPVLTYPEHVTVILKRTEMKYTKTASLVTTMDLSRNNLSGQIPQELTSLYGLRSLNLSGNHLEGKIPKNIGSLQQLESLDLSQNHLSGTIPASISNLTSLSSLNLSNNNLFGRIPSGNQLQTLIDPSIYTGNNDLCGPPLPKLCPPEVVPQPPNTFHGEEEKDGTEHWWFYVGVAPGFVAGFWLTCGVLIFKKSWRIAYFRFFSRLNERLDEFYVKMVVTMKKKIKG